MGLVATYLNIVKAVYKKHTAIDIQNGEKFEAILLELERRQGCSLTPFLSVFVLKSLAGIIRQRKDISGILIGKKKSSICR